MEAGYGGRQQESNLPGSVWRPLLGLKPSRTAGYGCLPSAHSNQGTAALLTPADPEPKPREAGHAPSGRSTCVSRTRRV